MIDTVPQAMKGRLTKKKKVEMLKDKTLKKWMTNVKKSLHRRTKQAKYQVMTYKVYTNPSSNQSIYELP